MRRKILLVLFLTISIFFIKDDVLAKVNYKNTDVQCIYGSGVQINMRYDKTSQQNEMVNRISIKLSDYPVGTSQIAGEALTNIALFDCDGDCIEKIKTLNFDKLKPLVCPDKIVVWRISISEETANGDWQSITKGIYSFESGYSFLTESKHGSADQYITSYYGGSAGKNNGLAWWFGAGATKKTRVLPIDGINYVSKGNPNPNSDNQKGWNNISIPLVAERLYMTDDIGNDAYSQAFRVYRGDADGDGKEDDAQAVGGNKYIQLYKGDSSKYFLHIGKTITSISATEAGYFNNEYICVKESTSSEDASRGDSYKTFSSSRHKVTSSSKTGTCSTGYTKYVRTTKICKPKVDTSAGSFCDKYPNVAFVLIDIIQIMQVLVPALVIVFTGVEIGRIVVAGNIAEELPKRKNSIIIRMIVMIAFLFLPLITQLIVSLAEGVSILDVSCLFNDGKEPAELNEDICEEEVKN